MHFVSCSKMSIVFSLFALATVLVGLVAANGPIVRAAYHANGPAGYPAYQTYQSASINCATGFFPCKEVRDSEKVFGHYVGHDEPSVFFLSNQPGSGNRLQLELTLPTDLAPTPLTPGKSFNFQLRTAFWFGMVLCDTQSYPEQISTCTPDSDQNIVDPTVSPRHPGAAIVEVQFYPPGWVPVSSSVGVTTGLFPEGFSCDATRWCAALTVDSLSFNPVMGQNNNATCLNTVGDEPVNFAFITRDGKQQAPANPVQMTRASRTPDPKRDLFMNSGDRLIFTMHDTEHGLRTDIQDLSTEQSGSMTASAANTFGQVKFDPTGTTCQNIPYDFHPMYSTASEKAILPWGGGGANISYTDEIGHFDYCNGPNVITPGGNCPTGNKEGIGTDQEPTDADDQTCFPAAASLRVKVSGCLAASNGNIGFDGLSYQKDWPDGNIRLHPTSVRFSSPLTGQNYNINYNRVEFETDLPSIEETSTAANCNTATGAGCTLIPITDDNTPAAFYPFFSSREDGDTCTWAFGDHIPGNNDFGGNQQYGPLHLSVFTGLDGTLDKSFDTFQQIVNNVCEANPNFH